METAQKHFGDHKGTVQNSGGEEICGRSDSIPGLQDQGGRADQEREKAIESVGASSLVIILLGRLPTINKIVFPRFQTFFKITQFGGTIPFLSCTSLNPYPYNWTIKNWWGKTHNLLDL